MTDFILCFPSKEFAQQFGLANGFSFVNESGEVQSSLASHEYALHIIGEHFTGGEENIPIIGDGQWWVLFRDLIGIPIPDGAEQFIYWTSASGEERPADESVPSIWWA